MIIQKSASPCFRISIKDNRRTEPQFHEIVQFLPEQVLGWKQSLPLMTLSPCTPWLSPAPSDTHLLPSQHIKAHPQYTAVCLCFQHPPGAPPTTRMGSQELPMQGHPALIHSLVLTSVLSCQLLANYFPCQNNYWERKNNFPSNPFSPSSSSPHPCLAVFHSTSPRHTQKSDRWRSEQLWLTHERP